MADDEQVATRVRVRMKGQRALVERKMFGELAYISHGKMLAGILNKDVVVRVGTEGNDEALKEPHTRPMDFTDRPLKGYVYVSAGGVATSAQLRKWLTKGLAFAASLPPAKRKVGGFTSTGYCDGTANETSSLALA